MPKGKKKTSTKRKTSETGMPKASPSKSHKSRGKRSPFPKSAIRREMKKEGVDRVGDEAISVIQGELEDALASIAHRTKALARHAGRKTVTKKDVKMDGI